MKKWVVLILLMVGILPKINAQIDTISTSQVGQYIDKNVVLKGVLMGIKEVNDRNGQAIMFLDIDANYPNTQVGVTIFPEANKSIIIDKSYVGKTILIQGKLTLYRDKPTIGVNEVKQISWL